MNQQGLPQAVRLEDEETRALPPVSTMHRRSTPVPFLPSVPSSQPDGHTIWVVDDSPTVRAVVTLHLTPLKVAVRPFATGREVLLYVCDHFQERLPPLILLDIEMPRIDGYTVLQTLRALPSSTQTAIVMMSARDNVESRLKSRLAGAANYLIKPVSCDTLLAVALTYLGERVPQTSGVLEATSHG